MHKTTQLKFRTDAIYKFLKKCPKEYRPALACALSVAHWSPKEWDILYKTNHIFWSECGMCIHYRMKVAENKGIDDFELEQVNGNAACLLCPFKKCSSLWHQVAGSISEWHGQSGFDLAAEKMYNALVALYEKEYEKAVEIYEKE
jgi:hypothetical protein